MKALILAGGRGSRLGEVTEDRNKCMAVYNGRFIIENSLDNALAAGVDEIVLLVGYKAESIINEFGIGYRGTPVRYVIQWERRGLVHAMECAQKQIDGHDFLLLLADEVMVNPRHAEMTRMYRENAGIFALCGIVHVKDLEEVKKTYTVICDETTGRIHRLIEKPRTPLNSIQGTGNCLFRNEIFNYIPHTPINQTRQEKELPDLIQCAVDDGKAVHAFEICSWYANVNTSEELLRRPESEATAHSA